jgi:hypothetical protein
VLETATSIYNTTTSIDYGLTTTNKLQELICIPDLELLGSNSPFRFFFSLATSSLVH